MNFKNWGRACLCLILACLIGMSAVTIIIDPFFHYHAPLPFLEYSLFHQRYQNDGIVKHFSYDALITGNSMSENFKTTQVDEIFNVKSVKVPFSGAGLKELDMNNRAAVKANKNIKMILMNLDWRNFISDKDYTFYDEDDYPNFLYNDNPFDDVKYLLNKSIFISALDVLYDTVRGVKGTTMDIYSSWGDNPDTVFGLQAIIDSFIPSWECGESLGLDEQREKILRENIEQNLLALIRENPQIDFYYFMPPHSMFFWARMYNQGELSLIFEAQQAVIEMLLEYDNVQLFSFIDDFELAQDYSRYKDYIHHDSRENEQILKDMAKGEHRLTKENYLDYLSRCRDFYLNFDYAGFINEYFGEETA